jgi:hypothetical protein
MEDIFRRELLKPSQLRSVARRRFEDAEWLRKSGENARANAVFYLGGFVIECLLKARMLERYPSMQRARSTEGMSDQDRVVWRLIYRSHDLREMLRRLPELQQQIGAADRREGARRLEKLNSLCQRWTIFARYSPRTETMKAAELFLGVIKDLRPWLEQRENRRT